MCTVSGLKRWGRSRGRGAPADGRTFEEVNYAADRLAVVRVASVVRIGISFEGAGVGVGLFRGDGEAGQGAVGAAGEVYAGGLRAAEVAGDALED